MTTPKAKPDPTKELSFRTTAYVVAFVVGLVVILMLWAVLQYVLFLNVTNVQDLGDVSSSVNALFAGWAFLGVIFAILLQKHELFLQRHEIQENRIQLERSADAQTESLSAFSKDLHAQSLIAARNILQSDEVRRSRQYVYDRLRRKQQNEKLGPSQWDSDDIEHAERVCHTFDFVGMMCQYNMLPAKYVVENWGIPIRKAWKVLSTLVQHRTRNGERNPWPHFEWLNKEAEEIERSTNALRGLVDVTYF